VHNYLRAASATLLRVTNHDPSPTPPASDVSLALHVGAFEPALHTHALRPRTRPEQRQRHHNVKVRQAHRLNGDRRDPSHPRRRVRGFGSPVLLTVHLSAVNFDKAVASACVFALAFRRIACKHARKTCLSFGALHPLVLRSVRSCAAHKHGTCNSFRAESWYATGWCWARRGRQGVAHSG
jgi:hypothetical protein